MTTMTVAQFAERFHCSREHVYNMIERGELSYHKIGLTKGIRITEEEASRWYESKKVIKKGPQENEEKPTPSETSASDKSRAIGSRTSARVARASARA